MGLKARPDSPLQVFNGQYVTYSTDGQPGYVVYGMRLTHESPGSVGENTEVPNRRLDREGLTEVGGSRSLFRLLGYFMLLALVKILLAICFISISSKLV